MPFFAEAPQTLYLFWRGEFHSQKLWLFAKESIGWLALSLLSLSIMTGPIETFPVSTKKPSCLGDKDDPHPRVWLAIGRQGFVDCPYCSKRFVFESERLSANAGIAIGPILFILALLAILATVMSTGGADFQIAGRADRIVADLTSQANMIRNTINNCNLQYQMALSLNAVNSAEPYPLTPTTSAPWSCAEDHLVSCMQCDPFGVVPLWGASTGQNGASGILLPQPTAGFSHWYYVNGEKTTPGSGRCIWTYPTTPNPGDDKAVLAGLSRVASKFNTLQAATATDTVHEALYNPSGSSQTFVIWITPPMSSALADSHCQSN